jgi:hypothetical protein
VKLMRFLGVTAAARELGTTTGTLHKARNANIISAPVEIAARGIWMVNGYGDAAEAQEQPRTSNLGAAVLSPVSEGTVLLLVQVPRGREAIIEKTVQAVGGVVSVQT